MTCSKNNAISVIKNAKRQMLQLLTVLLLPVIIYSTAYAQADTTLKNTLPAGGKMVNGKPVGKGWVDMLANVNDWNFENTFWQLSNHMLHGSIGKEKEHHYSYTKKVYTDFELNVMIKMVGDEDANSGVCIRINPTSWDDAPGYQIDMGKGYWGSLWEERRGNMVQKFPDALVPKIVKFNDWNHYYIVAKGHHIQAWLNGVKTIDMVHDAGFSSGNIGFQLCHLHNPTVVDVKSLYVREIK
ncbi:MAG: DUF1080 domain-containing protein [Mucilaginibacter sp.]